MQNPEISLGEIQLIGIETRVSAESLTEIGELWQKFYANGIQDRIANCIDSRLFGLYSHFDAGDAGDRSFMIGCPVSDLGTIPQGMVGRAVPAQHYQVFRAEGGLPDALVETWQTIRQADIKRAFNYDFEIYDDRATDADNAQVDIFVSLA